MKNSIFFFVLLLASLSANAQTSYCKAKSLFLSFKGGYTLNEMAYMGFSFDVDTKPNLQTEIFADFHVNNERAFHTALVGAALKPTLFSSDWTNTKLSLSVGLAIGSDFYNFLAVPHAGIELSQSIKSKFELFVGNKNELLFGAPSNEKWRIGAFGGVRFPLY